MVGSEGRDDDSVIDTVYKDECGSVATFSSSHKSGSRSLKSTPQRLLLLSSGHVTVGKLEVP